MHTATGFSAKNVCSGHFISGFSQQEIMQQALLPISQSFRLVNLNIDEQKKLVDSEMFMSHSRRAVYKEGYGCILLPPGEKQLSLDLPPKSETKKTTYSESSLAWPSGTASINMASLTSRQAQVNKLAKDHFNRSTQDPDLRPKALVIIHNGKLIAENYARGVDATTPLLSWSMAKSITNLQVGLLVKQGLLSLNHTPDVPVWKAKNYQEQIAQESTGKAVASQEHRYQDITLAHLLTMTSGLAFDETYGIGGDAALMLSVVPDVDQFASAMPTIYPAGQHWSYSSGTTNIISGVIRRSFGNDFKKYLEFTQQQLFDPLGINSAVLEMDSAGNMIGSSYMYATARDWAKLGQLLLQKGMWNGNQILPASWIDYSTLATPANSSNRYGAHFWLNKNPKDPAKQRFWSEIPEDTYYMSGFQGQRVVIIPSKQLVFVRLGFTTPKQATNLPSLMKSVIEVLQAT